MLNLNVKKFSRDELMEMTTYELKKICLELKIIKAYQNMLDKEKLIDVILKYRGVDVSQLIEEEKEGGFERVQDVICDNLVTSLDYKNKIKIPAKITLYKEIGINNEDMYKVVVESESELEESNVLLINGKNYLCGILSLTKDHNSKRGNEYYLSAKDYNLRLENLKNKNYSLLFFKRNESEYLQKSYYSDKELPPLNLYYYMVPVGEFEIQDLEETKTVLCIDFGTSNTTAGAYLDNNYVSNPSYNDILNKRIKLNSINYVKFMDVSSKDENWIEMSPTMVYVSDCQEPKNIKYLFGYDAKQRMKKNNYSSSATIFQGIKRWVNSYEKIEEIYDEQGNSVRVTRGEIISSYMEYVINTAEHQFKCKFKNIHISSPVKLKAQFISMFQKIVKNYNVESEDVLDEGISVMYNTIANQIEKNNFYNGEEYKALVIDCGGGTTDLSSCSFNIEEGEISYKVNIKTTFENGDTNFGGNNITYRIMQFMKIVYANYYENDKDIIDIDKLISITSGDIFRNVDENGVDSIYLDLEKYYEWAEQIIPTKYKHYENRINEDYQRVKNNFFFLWEIADNMKKDFFQKTNILRNKFDSSEIPEAESDLQVTQLNKWGLSIIRGGEFENINKFPNVVFNIKEINKLIMADIYDIVRKFLEKFYESRELSEYSIIKLTGQSCRIDIFKEALKEFVPGRSIEFKQNKNKNANLMDLKLSCLNGVIRYMNSKKLGDIEVKIENDIPVIPYSISAYTFTGEEITIIESQKKIDIAKGNVSKPLSIREINFYLKSHEGALKKEYVYENNFIDYRPVIVEEIVKQYSTKISQEDTDNIRNGEVRFFLFSDEANWGFYVVPIARKEEQLYCGEKKYFAFEDDLSELNFFDGMK